ncbi:MAG TPA: acyl-CoA dehydrogenase family protein [Mycobacterium sp.]
MDFTYPARSEQLRARLREFLAEHWPVDHRAYAMNDAVARDLAAMEFNSANTSPEEVRAFFKALGAAGFLGFGIPERFGGRGGDHLDRFVVQSELCAAGAPYPNIAMTMVAPTLLAVGSDEFLEEHIPRVVRGEVEYCLGYTEPGAGTDLASLRTRATRDGSDFVLSGQKIFSSSAHYADYYFLAARTNPDAPKHQGISLFLIPMSSPGISVTPLITVSGVRTNIVFIDDVRVPASTLVGRENAGWRYLTEALAFERYASTFASPLMQAYQAMTALDGEDGQRPDAALARLRADVRAAELLNLHAAWTAAQGRPPVTEAAASKLVITETRHLLSGTALARMGRSAVLDVFDPDAPAGGQFNLMYRHSVINLFTAGANAIQRDVIAQAGHGLPRRRRPRDVEARP